MVMFVGKPSLWGFDQALAEITLCNVQYHCTSVVCFVLRLCGSHAGGLTNPRCMTVDDGPLLDADHRQRNNIYISRAVVPGPRWKSPGAVRG